MHIRAAKPGLHMSPLSIVQEGLEGLRVVRSTVTMGTTGLASWPRSTLPCYSRLEA